MENTQEKVTCSVGTHTEPEKQARSVATQTEVKSEPVENHLHNFVKKVKLSVNKDRTKAVLTLSTSIIDNESDFYTLLKLGGLRKGKTSGLKSLRIVGKASDVTVDLDVIRKAFPHLTKLEICKVRDVASFLTVASEPRSLKVRYISRCRAFLYSLAGSM